MASSSVSQESLDRDDYDISSRRSKLRPPRGRPSGYRAGESGDTADGLDQNGKDCENLEKNPNRENESPTRPATRTKESKRRPNHLPKAKSAKDKRKMREKRRSTGVVHLPSTESTGDSLDEDDEKLSETKKNTSQNEVIDADNPQTPVENRISKAFSRNRNKSPSDLEADLEDNQDYDSTVSQSETNLTMIGQPTFNETQPSRSRFQPEETQSSRSRYQPDRKYTRNDATNNYGHRDRGTGNQMGRSGFNRFDRDSSGLAKLSYKECNIDIENSSPRYKGPTEEEKRLKKKNEELEKLLEQERGEKKRLQEILEDRERQLARLEREIALLNQDLDALDEENENLITENRALLRAVSTMGSDV